MTAKGMRPSKSRKHKNAKPDDEKDRKSAKKRTAKKDAAKHKRAAKEKSEGPAKQAGSKQAGSKQARPKQARPKQARPKQARPKQARPKQARTKQDDKKQNSSKQNSTGDEPVPVSSADVWLDPASRSGFVTLAWLSQAATVRQIRLTVHLVSESVAEDGLEVAPERRRWLDGAWAPVRVAHAVQRHYGQEQLHSFLIALGLRLHELGEPIGWGTVEGSLSAVGLPGEMAQLGFTGDNDEELRQAHFAAVAASGEPVPTTVLLLDGVGWTAPEWHRVPFGESAGVAYDAIADLGRASGLISLRRRPLG